MSYQVIESTVYNLVPEFGLIEFRIVGSQNHGTAPVRSRREAVDQLFDVLRCGCVTVRNLNLARVESTAPHERQLRALPRGRPGTGRNDVDSQEHSNYLLNYISICSNHWTNAALAPMAAAITAMYAAARLVLAPIHPTVAPGSVAL